MSNDRQQQQEGRTMTTATVVCRRDGNVTLRVPRADVRADGTVWYKGNPILDGSAVGALPKSAAAELVRSKAWDKIPATMYARMGVNPSGLELVDDAVELAAARQAAMEYRDAHPEMVEREAISQLFAAAYRSEQHDTDDNQMMRAMRQRSEATSRLAAWRAKYPDAARAEEASELRSRAADKRELAVGALVYDCDGSLSREMQQERHDCLMREADDLDAQAAAL
jgi:hypothetical protein